mgnify:CR=1 FL=1
MSSKRDLPPLDELLVFLDGALGIYQRTAISQALARQQTFTSTPPPPVSPTTFLSKEDLKFMLQRTTLKGGLIENLSEALYPLGVTVSPLKGGYVFVKPYGLRPEPYRIWYNGAQYVAEPAV